MIFKICILILKWKIIKCKTHAVFGILAQILVQDLDFLPFARIFYRSI